MRGRTANQLTLFSNNRIDFSRIGELAATGKHRYSNKELAIRAAIILTIAAFSLAGYCYNQQRKSGISDLSAAILMGIVGLIVGHIPAIGHLVMKRHHMYQDNEALIRQITLAANVLSPEEQREVNSKLQEIKDFTLADENHSRATMTLAKQGRLLEKLMSTLNEPKKLQHKK